MAGAMVQYKQLYVAGTGSISIAVDGTTLCWVRLFWSCCKAGAIKTTLYMEYNYFRAVLGSIVLLLFDSEG